jgi:hypothetical protein
MNLLNECEYSKMVWRKLGITGMTVPNLLGLMLRHSEIEIRSVIIAQLVFRKHALSPNVLTKVTIGNYVIELVNKNNFYKFFQARPVFDY